MPNRDKTGREGKGERTGRGLGGCSGSPAGNEDGDRKYRKYFSPRFRGLRGGRNSRRTRPYGMRIKRR